uniref:Solute carrier family 22 member 13a n=1 Tax=Fundulus heteroclitus TaxID=8078 RepID=A0A3Q2QVV7_FUNHE
MLCNSHDGAKFKRHPAVEAGTLTMADFGEILRNIGEFGLFQKTILFALCFPNLILPFHFTSVIFTQSDPERHCNTDWILKAAPNLTAEEQLNLTLPREEDGSFSRCRMFVPVDWDIHTIREHGLNDTTACTDGFVYENMLYESTIVTDSNMAEVTQTIFMTGMLAGSFIFGPVADLYGRRRTTQLPVVLLLIFIIAAAVSPNVHVYNVSQFIVGASFVLAGTEWIGVSKRSWGACITQLCAAIGQAILGGMIYFIRDWRLAQMVTAAPIAVIAFYIWFIPESARWLLDRGRTEEAKELIIKVAAINKRKVSDSLLEKVLLFTFFISASKHERDCNSMKGKHVVLTLFVSCRFSLNVTYFCLSLNVGNFGLDIFLTQALFGLSEVPAHIICIWLLEAVGRKVSLMSTLLMGGLLCMLILAVPQSKPSQNIINRKTVQTASGLGSIASRVGGLLSPLLNMLAVYHWSIPIVVYSSFTILSGALCFLLPETRRTELPDSTREAEGNG